MFTQKEIFAKALLIEEPWFVHEIRFNQDEGKLEIWIDFDRGSAFYFEDKEHGISGHYKAYDTKLKTWRHLNFFQYQCYLHAWIPRVKLENGQTRQVQPPWEGVAKGFTLLFEALIIELLKVMPVRQVGLLLGVYDKKLWGLVKQYTDQARAQEDYAEVEVVGVDETAIRRGHDYVSLFVDLKGKRTIYATEGRGQDTVAGFATDLTEHNGSALNINQVTCDMSPAYIRGVTDHLPHADIVFDRFHVMKLINEAVDKVRRSEAASNPILKGTKYLFLKNSDSLTRYQKQHLDHIKLSGLNLKTLKALLIREAYQQIYQAPTVEIFERLLKKWYFWATHSRIEQVKQVAYTIRRHWYGIINWVQYRISTGILEGFNSVFQAAKAKARGYQRTDTIVAVIYLLTGKLDFSKINYHYVTHTK